jgi:ribosomal protein S18 acetylase RimI-like enzyme
MTKGVYHYLAGPVNVLVADLVKAVAAGQERCLLPGRGARICVWRTEAARWLAAGLVSEVSWRAAGLADAADLAGLFTVIELAAPIGLETEPGEVAARLSLPQLDLAADTLLGTDAARGLVAYAEAAAMGTGGGQFRVRLTCAVHPGAGGGVLGAALDWLTGRARQLRSGHHRDLAGIAAVRCAAADHARRAALTAAGFGIDHWHHEMIRGTAGPVPARAAADGVTVIPYDVRYCEAARLAQNDAFADEPHGRLLDEGEWPQYAVGLATFLPAASFLALDRVTDPAGRGQQVVAFVLSLQHHGQGGGGAATLVSLGTRGRWRGQGLATTLISHALTACRQAGLTTVRLEVCSHNTSAVSLYTGLGFAASDRGYAIWMGPIR